MPETDLGLLAERGGQWIELDGERKMLFFDNRAKAKLERSIGEHVIGKPIEPLGQIVEVIRDQYNQTYLLYALEAGLQRCHPEVTYDSLLDMSIDMAAYNKIKWQVISTLIAGSITQEEIEELGETAKKALAVEVLRTRLVIAASQNALKTALEAMNVTSLDDVLLRLESAIGSIGDTPTENATGDSEESPKSADTAAT